jgi:hypothetical protein
MGADRQEGSRFRGPVSGVTGRWPSSSRLLSRMPAARPVAVVPTSTQLPPLFPLKLLLRHVSALVRSICLSPPSLSCTEQARMPSGPVRHHLHGHVRARHLAEHALRAYMLRLAQRAVASRAAP